MNLKQRMQHQNKNNSSILNNSNFDFGRPNKEDQVYQKSRQECEEQLYKRKGELEQERYGIQRTKEKELNSALERFGNDFEEIRKQIIAQINLSLSESKAKYISEIRERCFADTAEQVRARNVIDQQLAVINGYLAGLKKQQYRQYIARIVVYDFDAPREEIKAAIRRIRLGVPQAIVDDKYYSCLRNDLPKAVVVDYNMRREQSQSRYGDSMARSIPLPGEINLHQNRDRLKKSFQ